LLAKPNRYGGKDGEQRDRRKRREEIYNKHMIPDNKHMKYDETKGLKKEGATMSLHVGRSKSSPPLGGLQKINV